MVRQIDGFYSEIELARRVDMSIWGLRAWRRRGYGPESVKIGKCVFYPQVGVDTFLASLSGK